MLEIDLLARCIMAYTHKFRKTPDSLNRLTEIFNQLPLKNSDDRKTKYSCDGKNFTLIADIYFNDKKYTIKRSYSFPEYNQKN
jgi:mRNA-degrading endonuclease HigB of HigAB toxin-antitoxin module